VTGPRKILPRDMQIVDLAKYFNHLPNETTREGMTINNCNSRRQNCPCELEFTNDAELSLKEKLDHFPRCNELNRTRFVYFIIFFKSQLISEVLLKTKKKLIISLLLVKRKQCTRIIIYL